MADERDLVSKQKSYDLRFPSSLIKQAQALFWSYVDEKHKSGITFIRLAFTTDGETIRVKTDEEFYFGYDDANTAGSNLRIGLFSGPLLDVTATDVHTSVRVELPSRAHVDNVLELFAREERRLRTTAPQAVREEGDKQPEGAQKPSPPKLKIYIGHGHDPQWKDLRDFLNRHSCLETVFFESSSTAGHETADVIRAKIASADMAFMVHTGEDEDKSGGMHARTNVVHEAGMTLNQLGSGRAIVLLERGCTEYSNIEGTDQIRFPKGEIEKKFGDVLLAILREFPGRL